MMIRLIQLSLLLATFSCTPNTTSAQNKLKPEAFETMLKTDTSIQLIDVRTPEEFNSGHLAGARNLNYNGATFAQDIQTLDKSRPVLVYCALGGRSAAAAKLISAQKFLSVLDLKGGINAWKAEGKPVTQ